MARFYNRLMLAFLALFFLGTGAAVAYQFLYVIPAQKCETAGSWWEPQARVCATPVYLPHITGRPVGDSARAAAAAGLPEAEQRSPKANPDPRPAF